MLKLKSIDTRHDNRQQMNEHQQVQEKVSLDKSHGVENVSTPANANILQDPYRDKYYWVNDLFKKQNGEGFFHTPEIPYLMHSKSTKERVLLYPEPWSSVYQRRWRRWWMKYRSLIVYFGLTFIIAIFFYKFTRLIERQLDILKENKKGHEDLLIRKLLRKQNQ